MKKIFYIVLDGLGDLPIEEFGNKTPLEAAKTPYLDFLAQEGMQGVLFPVGKGIAPESDIAVISLLGYDAHKVYTGRGPLEAFASGEKIEDGDLALRANFATIDPSSKRIIDRRVARSLSSEEAHILAEEINTKVKLSKGSFVFKSTVGHRAILVIRKDNQLSGFITNTDPAYGREGVFGIAKEKFEPFLEEASPMPGYENDPKAILASELLNEFTIKSIEVLENSSLNRKRKEEGKLPANLILCRDAGSSLPKFTPISTTTGFNFACFVQMPVERGIALLCGMEIVDVPQSCGDLSKDYTIWAELAIKNIDRFDGLYIHIKGPDEPAHDGNYHKKKEIIELIDGYFFKNLLENIDKDKFIICVTADHSTPCKLKAHSADPVPVLIYGKGKDTTTFFGERESYKGSLGQLLGKDLIYKLVEFAKDS